MGEEGAKQVSDRIRCHLRGIDGSEPLTGEAAKGSPWTRGPIDEFYGMHVQIRPDKPDSLNAGCYGTIRSAPHYLRDEQIPHYHVIEDGTNAGTYHHADDLIPAQDVPPTYRPWKNR
jgi:hypothetical protein